MDLLQEPPSGFEAVAKAFAMAKLLPTTHSLNQDLESSEDPSFIRRTPVELWGSHASEPAA